MGVFPFKQIRAAATNAIHAPLHAGYQYPVHRRQKEKAARKPLCQREPATAKAYLPDAGELDAPDDELAGEVPDEPEEDDFDFLAFLCFFDFLCFGCASVPAAPVASVSDAPELADGLVELELPLAPEVPEAPEVSLDAPGLVVALLPAALGEVALLPEVPEVPELPEVSLLMPEDEVPLDPDNEGDDDMLLPLVLSFELEVEGEVALLLVSAPVPWASATEDTDATRTNDNDWIVVFNVMSNSLGWKKGIIDAAAWMRGTQARSPALASRRPKFRQIFSSPLKSKDFLTM
jgi:hypothetical protein